MAVNVFSLTVLYMYVFVVVLLCGAGNDYYNVRVFSFCRVSAHFPSKEYSLNYMMYWKVDSNGYKLQTITSSKMFLIIFLGLHQQIPKKSVEGVVHQCRKNIIIKER